jgi:hypothetical protein
MKSVGTEIFWPWYTLIGAVVTMVTAWLMCKWFSRAGAASGTERARG